MSLDVSFLPGDYVKVVKALSDTEQRLIGRIFRFTEYTQTHGYARVQDEHGIWLLHPEALTLVEKWYETSKRETLLREVNNPT